MNKPLLFLLPLLLYFTQLKVQTPILDAWTLNKTSTIAKYYTTTGFMTSTGLTADVTKVCYSTDSVWIKTTGMPAVFGPWKNPGTPSDQNFTFRFPRNPQAATVNVSVPVVFATGVLINGAPIFGTGDAKSYKSSTGSNVSNGDGLWNGNAYYSEGHTLDTTYAGHVNQDGTYHSHATPYKIYKNYSTSVHSPIVGFAFDGYPVYGPYGYSDATNSSSSVKRISSSYQLRNISDRTKLPNGTTSNPAGPAISTSFPLGMYIEDYEYVSGLGDLDDHNGRWCVTPEYPNGTYAYFVTIDASSTPAYPYYIGTTYYGKADQGNLTPNSTISMPANPTGCVNDYPTVTLSVSPSSVSEAAGTSTVTAKLSASTTQNVTVNLSLSGTASSGTDYSLGSSIVITAGNTTGSVTLTAINDTKYEGNETVIIDISSVANATESGTQQATITITEDDAAPTVTLSTGASSISETGGSTTVTATLSAASDVTTTVNLSTSGTGTVNTDYTIGTSITIAAGNTSGSVTLASVSDTKYEGNETVIIDISSLTNGTESGTQQSTVTITDDDAAPTVTLSTTSSSISETGGSTTIKATLSAASALATTVNLSLSGTATVTSDYTMNTVITIPAGSTFGTITLSSVSDTKYEGNETVIVDITSVTNGTESGTQQVTVTITDDDVAPSVTLSTNSSSISENGGTATVTATLSAASALDVTVTLGLTGTATVSSDYSLSTSITITAGNTTGTATLSSIDDATQEGDETVIIDITAVTNGTESGTQQKTITIVDDEAPEIDVMQNTTAIASNGSYNFGTVSIGNNSTVTFTIKNSGNYDLTISGIAKSGTDASDFTLGTVSSTTIASSAAATFTVTFTPSCGTNKSASITISNDDSNEGSYVIALSGTASDVTIPTITCPSDVNVNSSTSTTVNYDAPIVLDNCSGTNLTLMSGFSSGSMFPVGTTLVSYKVTDIGNNTAACTFNVKVSGQATAVVNKVVIESEIYPNPVNSLLNVDVQAKVKQIEVMNNYGLVVRTIANPEYSNTIDVSDLADGLYFVRISNEVGYDLKKINVSK